MLKVCYYENFSFQVNNFSIDKRFINAETLRKFDIELVDDPKQAKIILAHKCDAELLLFVQKSFDRYIILLERYDSSVPGSSITFKNLPELIAVFKEYVMRTYTPSVKLLKKRHHLALLKPDHEDVITFDWTREEFDKYMAVPWNLKQYGHDLSKVDMAQAAAATEVKKDIDVFCVCHDHDHVVGLNDHRRNIKSILRSESHKWNVVTEPISNKKTFIETLVRAKIVVAPYGLGERIASDQFAIWAGCVLVKPECSFVKTVPDIYTEEFCVFVQPDGSDLIETVQTILGNLPKYQLKTKKARALFDNWTHEKYEELLARSIRKCYERHVLEM